MGDLSLERRLHEYYKLKLFNNYGFV